MKNNVRKALAISGLAIAIGTTGFTFDASANTARKTVAYSHQERITKTRKIEHTNISRRAFVGTASNITENSLTLTKGIKNFTVSISSTTKLLNHNWKKLTTIDEIKDGDKIRVLGTLTDTTITAKTIRDISIK